MTANVSTMSFTPTGASTYRTLGAWTGDVCNVKNFGAMGDGSHDDTTAIQAAIDAAFGSYASPHGGSSPDFYSNKPLYFPAGHYIVTSRGSQTITGAVDNGSGAIRLTVASTASFTTNDPVLVNGVSGTTEANGLWFISVIGGGTAIDLVGSTFTHAFSGSGATIKLPALKMKARGALIYGSGRQSTNIDCTTSACACISTNGFDYSMVRDINFSSTTDGVAFDLDWTTLNQGADNLTLQSNTFFNCNMGFSSGGLYGLAIGAGLNMGSENLILNCYFQGATAGLFIGNANALEMTVIGGNFAACVYGIYSAGGSCPVIHCVSFQNNTGYDIKIVNSVGDNYSVHGCRSEGSDNFLSLQNGNSAHVGGCTQLSPNAGIFCSVEGGSGVYPGSICLDSNYSKNGIISSNGEFYMRGNLFANTSPLSGINTTTGVVHSYDNVGANPCTVANLPAAAACYKPLRMTVTNSNAAGAGNFGAIVAGGGSNVVPVYCDGTNWRIG